jgi:alkanesulfonate monooxygenase SsuD/methylene tetrahydromethanopterin reductase-like flavin-dependent oxidoreductase (luciferase family)
VSAFRLGFLTHVEGGRDLKESYLNAQELFVAADELGFDSGWVAQHHVWDNPGGGLPSPWTFLSNVAAKTTRIHLGTAVTILPLEDPLRLAEDVAVVDLLSGGRVELGVGSGFDPIAYRAFGKDFERKRELTTEHLRILRSALAGEPLFDGGPQLKPLAPELAQDRLWQAVFSGPGARYAAGERSNLLLNRATYGYAEPTDVVQRPWADAYIEELAALAPERRPRIGVSRLIFTADSRKAALDQIADGALASLAHMKSTGGPGGDLGDDSLENALFRFHATYGTPDDVVASLQREQVLPVATDLLSQFNPGKPELKTALKALELLATEVAPALGWVPTHRRELAAAVN